MARIKRLNSPRYYKSMSLVDVILYSQQQTPIEKLEWLKGRLFRYIDEIEVNSPVIERYNRRKILGRKKRSPRTKEIK